MAGRHTISCVAPFPCRPIPKLQMIGSKMGITPTSALRSRASPITGTRLRQLPTRLASSWSSLERAIGVGSPSTVSVVRMQPFCRSQRHFTRQSSKKTAQPKTRKPEKKPRKSNTSPHNILALIFGTYAPARNWISMGGNGQTAHDHLDFPI